MKYAKLFEDIEYTSEYSKYFKNKPAIIPDCSSPQPAIKETEKAVLLLITDIEGKSSKKVWFPKSVCKKLINDCYTEKNETKEEWIVKLYFFNKKA
jgi:hypothetical protein